jgi:hypothetical protein
LEISSGKKVFETLSKPIKAGCDGTGHHPSDAESINRIMVHASPGIKSLFKN